MGLIIGDLEEEVADLQQESADAKNVYLAEFEEYTSLAADFVTVEQKDDFLAQEIDAIAKVFPQLATSRKDILASRLFLGAAGVETFGMLVYAINRYHVYKLVKAVKASGSTAQLAGRFVSSKKVLDAAKAAQIGSKSRLATISKTANLGRIVGAAAFIATIAAVAIQIKAAKEKKKFLQEQKKELQEHVDVINSIIDETNESTAEIVEAFLVYFNALDIDVGGMFNDNHDGFQGEEGLAKFKKPETGAISKLREAINGAISALGALQASIAVANNIMNFLISSGTEGDALITQVISFTGMQDGLVRRLYANKLQELGSSVDEAVALCGLEEDEVREVYARAHLDSGSTIEEAAALSGLKIDRVRRIFAAKLLDDALTDETPDDVLDLAKIAAQTELSEEDVRQIRAELLGLLQDESGKAVE